MVIRQASDDAMKASFCVRLVAKAEIHTPPHNPNFFHQIVIQLLQAGDFTPHSVVEKTIEVIAEAEDPEIQSAAVDACFGVLAKGESMSDGLLEVSSTAVLPFSKLNKIIFGCFDPENIFLDNENKYFLG